MRSGAFALLVLALAGCQTLLAPVPRFEEPDASDALDRAARCLETGDDAGAVPHLEAVVKDHPDQVMFRAELAELLYKLDRVAEAKPHFERFVSTAQDATGAPQRHLVHCHTRLMELAARDEDRAEEAFHRGVGLLLLAGRSDGGEDGFEESVLGRAVKALAAANEGRPHDPRILLYLGDAYAKLGSRPAAARAWREARAAAVPGSLTPAEQRRLNEVDVR